MEIASINWKEIYENMTQDDITTKFFTLLENKDILVDNFWEQLYPVLASVKPLKGDNGLYSAKALINFLSQHKYDEVETPYGKTTYSNLSYLMALLSAVSRSKLLSYRMTSEEGRKHSTLVPLFLAAHKHYNGIKYSEWDKSDTHIKHVLGYQLVGILDVAPNFNIDITKLADYRNEALTVRKTGERKPNTGVIAKKIKLSSIDGREHWFKSYHVVPPILLQTWVANVEWRHEDMILDLNDWDNMPEAYDDILEIKKAKHHSKLDDELPF